MGLDSAGSPKSRSGGMLAFLISLCASQAVLDVERLPALVAHEP